MLVRGKCVAKNAYIKKQERSQISNLALQLKELEKEKQTKLEAIRRKENVMIGTEINELGKRKTTKLTNLQVSGLRTKKRVQIHKLRNKNGDIITNRNRKDYESTMNNCMPTIWITR